MNYNHKSYAFCHLHSMKALKFMLGQDKVVQMKLMDVKNRSGYRCSCGRPAALYFVELEEAEKQ